MADSLSWKLSDLYCSLMLLFYYDLTYQYYYLYVAGQWIFLIHVIVISAVIGSPTHCSCSESQFINNTNVSV